MTEHKDQQLCGIHVPVALPGKYDWLPEMKNDLDTGTEKTGQENKLRTARCIFKDP
ncbi:hypothetical protein PPNK14_17460 [Pectobacterium parmentieri]